MKMLGGNINQKTLQESRLLGLLALLLLVSCAGKSKPEAVFAPPPIDPQGVVIVYKGERFLPLMTESENFWFFKPGQDLRPPEEISRQVQTFAEKHGLEFGQNVDCPKTFMSGRYPVVTFPSKRLFGLTPAPIHPYGITLIANLAEFVNRNPDLLMLVHCHEGKWGQYDNSRAAYREGCVSLEDLFRRADVIDLNRFAMIYCLKKEGTPHAGADPSRLEIAIFKPPPGKVATR